MTTKNMARVEVCAHEEGRAKARPYTCPAPKDQKIDGTQIWKQFEDLLIPRLRLSAIERAVYSYLLRHTRLEGRRRLRFSVLWLARGACLSTWLARRGLRRLIAKGVLRVAEVTKRGHIIEVRLPEEVRAVRKRKIPVAHAERSSSSASLEEADFFETRTLRLAIHAREAGRCFYCLRRTTSLTQCIDHVIPQVRMGRNSYRNLVSTCIQCNSRKRERPAEDFLRWLFREGRLGAAELKQRLHALARLAAGKLRPPVKERPQAASCSRRLGARYLLTRSSRKKTPAPARR